MSDAASRLVANPLPDPTEVRARMRRLQKAAFGPLGTAQKGIGSLVVVAGGPIAFVAGTLNRDRLTGIEFGLVAVVVGAALVLIGYRKKSVRLALELYSDHNCHERAEFERETGSKMPRTLKGVERWLAEHPAGPDGAGFEIGLGRIAEADRRVAGYVPDTPDHAFDLALVQRMRAMALSEPVDIAGLLAELPTLPDARERRHRRECIALLEAELAADRGEDPIAVLARVRTELDDVYWRYRTVWSLGLLFAAGALFVLFSGLLGGSLGFHGIS